MNMAQRNLEEQVKTLEARVARLERSIVTSESDQRPGMTATEFLQTFSGIFENDPIYLEAMKLGAEWRESTRPKDKSLSRKRS